MRFRVLINSTPSQKAYYHIFRFLREQLIPYDVVCFSNPPFIIVRFLYKFIHLRNKHVKADALSLVFDFPILTKKTDFKQVHTFIQYYLNFSGVLESADL